jgi:hypothetical protein
LDHLEAIRERFQTITARFGGFQAQWLNVHVDFPLLQRPRPAHHRRCGALPRDFPPLRPRLRPQSTSLRPAQAQFTARFAGFQAQWLNVHVDFPLLQRLALPITVGAVRYPGTFHLSDRAYGLNQLRYDLRKLKGHGLLQRDGSRYAYRLTPKGVQVALLFLFFHKRLCGPLANSRFHHCPDPHHQPTSKLEAAYHRADKAIQQIVDLLAA